MTSYPLSIKPQGTQEEAGDLLIITSLAVVLAFSPMAMCFGYMAFSEDIKGFYDGVVLPMAIQKEETKTE